MSPALSLEILRHSLEHVMVLAVRRLFGQDIRLGVGPVIEHGFYQDFDAELSIDSFPAIEAEMRAIIDANLPFKRELIPLAEALQYFGREGQALKVELLEAIRDRGTSRHDGAGGEEEKEIQDLNQQGLVSLYSVGEHRDLCRGPHVEHAGMLRHLAFKLDRLAGAYWRGNEKNPMLSRIYGLAFPSEEELKALLERRAEALRRDHRKLGEQLELFFFHETAPGMPYWLPRGVVLKNTLIEYWREYHAARGYQEIQAPLLNKRELWEISGHWKYYKDDMFLVRHGASDGNEGRPADEWALKPMNCANAMIVWQQKIRSYRDLPLRLSDTDMLHRAERPGALSGLLRARCFCQDDAHNFVREEQIGDEIASIIEIVRDFYGVFGLRERVSLHLATRPDDFMGDIASWDRAEAALAEALRHSGLPFALKPKDGAFYGPKIDIHLKDSLERSWQCGTIQLDFQLPRNFKLSYVDESGARQVPVVIHRVIYGSLERFIGILLEHFAGRLPLWVAPLQVRIVSAPGVPKPYLDEVSSALAHLELNEPLRGNRIRFDRDESNESLGKQVRNAESLKIPVVLVVGKREAEARSVVVRFRGQQHFLSLQDLEGWIVKNSVLDSAPAVV